MTPLHCAAISHCVTMKALFACEMADVNLQAKAAEKLSCVQVLLNAGASPLSQVEYKFTSVAIVLHFYFYFFTFAKSNVISFHLRLYLKMTLISLSNTQLTQLN